VSKFRGKRQMTPDLHGGGEENSAEVHIAKSKRLRQLIAQRFQKPDNYSASNFSSPASKFPADPKSPDSSFKIHPTKTFVQRSQLVKMGLDEKSSTKQRNSAMKQTKTNPNDKKKVLKGKTIYIED
jgi:hypothetical protein